MTEANRRCYLTTRSLLGGARYMTGCAGVLSGCSGGLAGCLYAKIPDERYDQSFGWDSSKKGNPKIINEPSVTED